MVMVANRLATVPALSRTLPMARPDIFQLPVVCGRPPEEDQAAGLVRVVIDRLAYQSEGYIAVEGPPQNMIGCIWLVGGTYEDVTGVHRRRPVVRHYWTDFGRDARDAMDIAIRWQQEMAQQSGLVFPIWRR
jgi:hypothetical protein